MDRLHPYAPPSVEAQLYAPRRRPAVAIPTDPESVRLAHLWAERQVRMIAGTGFVFGLAILAWAFAVLAKAAWLGLIPALVLFALGTASVAGAYWLSRLEPSGRWCATGLSALLAICVAPAAWVTLVFEPRLWKLSVLLVVPIALLVALWRPRASALFDETYRRTVVPRTRHLHPNAALPIGIGVGVLVVGYLVAFGLRV